MTGGPDRVNVSGPGTAKAASAENEEMLRERSELRYEAWMASERHASEVTEGR